MQILGCRPGQPRDAADSLRWDFVLRAPVRAKPVANKNDILLTQEDANRIARHIGTTAFYEYRRPLDPGDLGDREDGNWLTYTLRPEGTRRVILLKAGGDCFFLEVTGCLLPQDKRPLICRLHPLLYTEAGVTGVSPDCPAEFLAAGETVLASVGMELATGLEWHAQLYAELRREGRTEAPPNEDLLFLGSSSPPAEAGSSSAQRSR